MVGSLAVLEVYSENIGLGNPKATDEEVKEAGKRLSGGEKQRISIARAILKNAPTKI